MEKMNYPLQEVEKVILSQEEQEEMDNFIKQELPEEFENYQKFVKKWKPAYRHTIRNFIILFFFPIGVYLFLALLIKLWVLH